MFCEMTNRFASEENEIGKGTEETQSQSDSGSPVSGYVLFASFALALKFLFISCGRVQDAFILHCAFCDVLCGYRMLSRRVNSGDHAILSTTS
ncbi:hypothetical protein L3X38_024080 [Prunus dulcis]|uniref:Uncharacterized protein n=1 Tax=Prunus dulcis TaxID=3755 RepID=A0AAD4VZ95_PRUDU|nr:hypothetical protein L3X38_024080 [Prunus dulcis]